MGAATHPQPQKYSGSQGRLLIGKWAIQMGRERDAKAAFEYVLSQFYSYYAWRSAAT